MDYLFPTDFAVSILGLGFFPQLKRKFPSASIHCCLASRKWSIKISIIVLSVFSSHGFNHANSYPLHDCSWGSGVGVLGP